MQGQQTCNSLIPTLDDLPLAQRKCNWVTPSIAAVKYCAICQCTLHTIQNHFSMCVESFVLGLRIR